MKQTKAQLSAQWQYDFGDHTECPECGSQCRDVYMVEQGPTKLYQIRVWGRRNWCDGVWTMASKRVFLTSEEAEAYKPEFRTKCTTDRFENDLTTLVNDDSFKIDIVELEL